MCELTPLKILFFHTNYERLAFGASVTIALLPIWLAGAYFVTGDGPCHTYNASVLLDWILGRHVDFYQQFYLLNSNFEPNYWTHAWLVLLQTIMSPPLAEKVFLTGYVLAFSLGLRFLLKQINSENLFLSTVGVVFCWHHLLQMGFFNYSWSLAGMFWLIGYWKKWDHGWSWKQRLLMALGWVALFSMHPMGFGFAALGIACIILGDSITTWRHAGLRSALQQFFRSAINGLIIALPALLLAFQYLSRHGWHKGNNDQSFSGILDAIATLTMLINMNDWEHPWVNMVVLLLVSIVATAVYQRFQKKKWHSGDIWLLFLAISLMVYFVQVGANSLELLMPLRLQLLPWFGLLFWTASAYFPLRTQLGLVLVALGLQFSLFMNRLPAHRDASTLVAEWTSLASYVEERSVVMVVNYDFNGTNDVGKPIGNRIWMFNHAADYIGATMPGIIMSDNYEALMRYFPLIWRLEGDMYNRTAIDGIGFEDRPPRVDLLGFPKRSQGRQIKYVLVLGQSEDDRQHERGRELMAQLDTAYQQIAVSTKGKAVLYRLKAAQ